MTTAYEPSGWDPWNYSESSGYTGRGGSLIGYDVEATDGKIGKVNEATNDVGASYIIVDTGPWIFGKTVMLPAGTINHVDTADEKVYVNQTKDQIKNAPEFDKNTYTGREYQDRLGDYYRGPSSGHPGSGTL